jgi:hypothetical protein
VEEARQAAAASDMHGYQVEDLMTRKVLEKGYMSNIAQENRLYILGFI